MTHDEAVEKIRKVLTLTTSSNEHEAALAAETALRLLVDYRLTLADVQASEIGRTVLTRHGGWADTLLTTVATACGCAALLHTTASDASMFGAWIDRRTAIRLYQQVRPVIDTRMRAAWAAHVASLEGPFGPHPATTEPGADAEWMDSYAYGAIEALRKRLTGSVEGPAAESQALVRVDRREARRRVDDYLLQHYGAAVTKLPRHVVLDLGAMREGRKEDL
jgi:hypothetical protein